MPFSDPKYPVVNPDPTVDDCVKSLRTSDYLGGALATASTWGYGFVIGKPYRFASANACATLGFTFATMYVMQNAVYRFTGYSENAKEVKKYGVHSTPPVAAVVASTSTHAETMEATTPTLVTLPDEILLNIAEFTGANSCYLGYGAVCKSTNELFNTHSFKLSKSTSYGGYAPLHEILQKCEIELEKGEEYEYNEIPEILRQLASGAVTFNRIELLEWAIQPPEPFSWILSLFVRNVHLKKHNKYVFHAIFERSIEDGKLLIMKKIWRT